MGKGLLAGFFVGGLRQSTRFARQSWLGRGSYAAAGFRRRSAPGFAGFSHAGASGAGVARGRQQAAENRATAGSGRPGHAAHRVIVIATGAIDATTVIATVTEPRRSRAQGRAACNTGETAGIYPRAERERAAGVRTAFFGGGRPRRGRGCFRGRGGALSLRGAAGRHAVVHFQALSGRPLAMARGLVHQR